MMSERDPVFATWAEVEAWAEREPMRALAALPPTAKVLPSWAMGLAAYIRDVKAAHAHLKEPTP